MARICGKFGFFQLGVSTQPPRRFEVSVDVSAVGLRGVGFPGVFPRGRGTLCARAISIENTIFQKVHVADESFRV